MFPYRDGRRRMKLGEGAHVKEARRAKAALITDVARGDHVPQSKVAVPDYGREWVDPPGRTNRAIGEHTRAEYRERLVDAFECSTASGFRTCGRRT